MHLLDYKPCLFATGEGDSTEICRFLLVHNFGLLKDSVRGTAARTNGAISQGIYEWEPDEGLVIPGRTARDLNKPPRPPKMRPAHRLERRITTDCVGLPSRIRYVPTGEDEMGVVTASPPMEYTPLRGFESPATPTGSVDDSYANYESIYLDRGRRVSEGGEVEKIDSQRLDVLMRPYMTSTNSEVPLIASPPSPPPPPSGSSGGPIYRTEVRHRPSIGENFVGQLKNFVSAFMELDIAPSNVIICYPCQLFFTYEFALKISNSGSTIVVQWTQEKII